MNEEKLLEYRTVMIVGHIVHSDIRDTIDQIDKTGYAEVVDLAMSMPGINLKSSARIGISAAGKEEARKAMNLMREIAKKKDLLVIEPIDGGGFAMKTLRIAVIGMGSVGQGVLKVLADSKGLYPERKAAFKIVAVADSKGVAVDENGLDPAKVLKEKHDGGLKRSGQSTLDYLKTGDYDILVEVTPTDAKTGEPGLSYITEALNRGKHVVTSNKGPLALQYDMLTGLAREKRRTFPVRSDRRRCHAGLQPAPGAAGRQQGPGHKRHLQRYLQLYPDADGQRRASLRHGAFRGQGARATRKRTRPTMSRASTRR